MANTPPVFDPTDPIGATALAKALTAGFAPQQQTSLDLIKRISDPNFIYNPQADLEAVAQQSKIASNLPTEADIAAQNAKLQAQGADYLLQQLAGVPTAQEGMLPQPVLPTLDLPNQPQTARAQVSPLAQLLTIGAGLAAPRMAGQFNAAALEGAIQGAAEENARRQQAYREDITRRSMLYDAAMSSAKERERIVEENRDASFRNSVATTDRQMALAKARTDQFMTHGAADSAAEFAKKYDPMLKARDQVKTLLDTIDAKGKASADQIKSVSELLTALNKEDPSRVGMAKNVFDQIMKSVQEAAQARAAEERATKVANIQADAAMARTKAVQSGEDARAAAERALRSSLQQNSQQFDMSKLRVQESLKPSEGLLQSRGEQSRLRGELSKIDEEIRKAESIVQIEESKRNNLPGVVHAINNVKQLLQHQEEIRKKLDLERKNSQRMQRGRGPSIQAFDPVRGEGTLP